MRCFAVGAAVLLLLLTISVNSVAATTLGGKDTMQEDVSTSIADSGPRKLLAGLWSGRNLLGTQATQATQKVDNFGYGYGYNRGYYGGYNRYYGPSYNRYPGYRGGYGYRPYGHGYGK